MFELPYAYVAPLDHRDPNLEHERESDNRGSSPILGGRHVEGQVTARRVLHPRRHRSGWNVRWTEFCVGHMVGLMSLLKTTSYAILNSWAGSSARQSVQADFEVPEEYEEYEELFWDTHSADEIKGHSGVNDVTLDWYLSVSGVSEADFRYWCGALRKYRAYAIVKPIEGDGVWVYLGIYSGLICNPDADADWEPQGRLHAVDLGNGWHYFGILG